MCIANPHAGPAAPINMAIDKDKVLHMDVLVPGMEREDLIVTCTGREVSIKHKDYDERLAKFNAGDDEGESDVSEKIELVRGWATGPFLFEMELKTESRVRACSLKNGVLSLELAPFVNPDHVVEIK